MARTVYPPRYRGWRVATELRALLDMPSYRERAQALAAVVQREDGVGTACDVIDRVLTRGAVPAPRS